MMLFWPINACGDKSCKSVAAGARPHPSHPSSKVVLDISLLNSIREHDLLDLHMFRYQQNQLTHPTALFQIYLSPMPGITNHDLTQEKVSGCLILQVWPLRIQGTPKAARWSSLSGGETNLLLLYDQGFGEIQLFLQVRDASWGNAGSDWIEQYVGFLAEGQGILCLFFLHHNRSSF